MRCDYVSGKGIAATVMACALLGIDSRGALYRVPLPEIVHNANEFFPVRDTVEIWTCVIIRVERDGDMEYLDCGHVQPLIARAEDLLRLPGSNHPVDPPPHNGITQHRVSFDAGGLVILVIDGV